MKRWLDTEREIQLLRRDAPGLDAAPFGQPYLIRPLYRTSRFNSRAAVLHAYTLVMIKYISGGTKKWPVILR
ncbi:hypothetical protein [Paenibacillus paeoniae]|uniref:hypothetical protein n=1 Tax=Paenibacillus paeoniae TaxID=2292705 RepID=UPI001058BDF8|nr:hypothetical protein [Paenibacillus paeoniae]